MSTNAVTVMPPVDAESPALTTFGGGLPSLARMQERMAQQKQMRALLKAYVRSEMDPTRHFYTIGDSDKPALSQDGARNLCSLYEVTVSESALEEEYAPDGHYRCKATITLMNLASGQAVARGTGSCSTRESKYAWRWVWPNDLPRTAQKADLKTRTTRKGQTLYRLPNDDLADQYNCVTPETRLLTHDLQWVAAGEIASGDRLMGVEEDSDNQYGRHLVIGEATVHGRKIDQLYEIVFEDGRSVRCNGEHRWLVSKVGGKGREWVPTRDIHAEIIERSGRPRHWSVMSLCPPWVEERSKEAGSIAGLLDADGSLASGNCTVLFAQQQNIVLALFQHALSERGYQLSRSICKTLKAVEESISQKQVYSMRGLGGFTEQLRLLGSIRPPRLLERWMTHIDVSERRLEARYCPAAKPARMLSIHPIGEGEIVLLGTSCHTYFAEGFACHNTVLKMAEKRALVAATLRLPIVSEIFDASAEEEAPDTDADRKGLLKQVGDWIRTVPRAVRLPAVALLFGVESFEAVQGLAYEQLDTALLRVEALEGKINWASTTLAADIARLETASAQQAIGDLYGDRAPSSPAPATPPPLPQLAAIDAAHQAGGLDASGLQDWWGKLCKRFKVAARDGLTAPMLTAVLAEVQAFYAKRQAPTTAPAPSVDGPALAPWRPMLADVLGDVHDADLAREATGVLEDADATTETGEAMLARVLDAIDAQETGQPF